MLAGIAALAWLSVALIETLPQLIGQKKQNVTGEDYFDPFQWGGAEGREAGGQNKCRNRPEV